MDRRGERRSGIPTGEGGRANPVFERTHLDAGLAEACTTIAKLVFLR